MQRNRGGGFQITGKGFDALCCTPLPPPKVLITKQSICKGLNRHLNYYIKVWNGKFLVTWCAVGHSGNKCWHFASYRARCLWQSGRACVSGACSGAPGSRGVHCLGWALALSVLLTKSNFRVLEESASRKERWHLSSPFLNADICTLVVFTLLKCIFDLKACKLQLKAIYPAPRGVCHLLTVLWAI